MAAARNPIGQAPAPMTRVRHFDLIVGLCGIAAAAASIWAAPDARGFLGAGLALLMLAVAVIDLRYFIIPDELTGAALVLGLVDAALAQALPIAESLAAAVLRGALTMLFFWGVRWIYRRLRRREGLGLGDVKLALVAGVWLDWAMIPVAIEIAALAALAAYAASAATGKRKLNATARMPFGLFFAPAIWLAWLTGVVFFTIWYG